MPTVPGSGVVLGYGTTGASAAKGLAGEAASRRLVVVDRCPDAVEAARRDGFSGVLGDATRSDVLVRARTRDADVVVVAVSPDATAVTSTTVARELNARCRIATAVREPRHESFARSCGADRVVVTDAVTGHLLGWAVNHPVAASFALPLLAGDHGGWWEQRLPRPGEIGAAVTDCVPMVIAVVRAGLWYWYTDPRVSPVRADDELIGLRPEWKAAHE